MKHTKGPWELRRDPFHFHTLSSIVGGETRGSEKKFPSHELRVEIGGFADVETQESNARLIAAAPAMLKALIELRDAPWNSMCGRANQLVEDAIHVAMWGSLHNAGVLPPETSERSDHDLP